MSLEFKVLALGARGTRIKKDHLRYSVIQNGKRLRIVIPEAIAQAGGLKKGDTVQFQVGHGSQAGNYALGKGTAHARTLGRSHKNTNDLSLTIPYLPPLHKDFPVAAAKELQFLSADPKGVIAFSVKLAKAA